MIKKKLSSLIMGTPASYEPLDPSGTFVKIINMRKKESKNSNPLSRTKSIKFTGPCEMWK